MSDLAVDPTQISGLYNAFRQVPLQAWQNAPADEIAKTIEKGGVSLDGRDPHAFGTAVRLFGRLAHEADEESFRDAITGGGLPPMKLTAAEMEVVRGGLAATGSVLLGVGIGLAASAIVGGIAYWLSH